MDGTGQRRVSYDIFLPPEPGATGVAVIASCFYGEAEARLIAAAPELAKACSQAVEDAKQGKGVRADTLNAMLDLLARIEGRNA